MSARAKGAAPPKYIDGRDYEALYANYFEKDPGALPALVPGGVSGRVVVDLCCGSAPVAREMAKMGARRVLAVDGEAAMLPRESVEGVEFVVAGVEAFLDRLAAAPVDAIVCRQAANYWMARSEGVGAKLRRALRPGGALVFNTFLDEPSREPRVKVIELGGGERIVESTWLAPDGRVHHAQFRSGLEPHATAFDWIPEAHFRKILGFFFDVELVRKGPSGVFVCRRK